MKILKTTTYIQDKFFFIQYCDTLMTYNIKNLKRWNNIWSIPMDKKYFKCTLNVNIN